MPLVSLTPLLEDAKSKHYAVGSFNVFDLSLAQAVLKAAEEQRSPVVLAVAASHLKYLDFDTFAPALVEIAARSSVPVAVHLDHSEELALVVRAIRAGFTSLMFDGHGLRPDEKCRQTRSVTDLAHSVDITVEAEFGHITKMNEDADQRDNLLIDTGEVAHFVEEARIDVVAAAAGSVHGLTEGATELDFDRLHETIGRTPCFVSLHGGSGMEPGTIKAAIDLGVVKFSYFTGLSRTGVAVAREVLACDPGVRITELAKSITDAMGEKAAVMMQVYGSMGHA